MYEALKKPLPFSLAARVPARVPAVRAPSSRSDQGGSSCGTRVSLRGFSCQGARALGAGAQELQLTGLIALRHVGSS